MSEQPFIRIGSPTRGGIIAIADHASNFVPEEIELGIPADLLLQHIAVDIGTAGIADRLARRHGIAAQIAQVSRLVIDLHRNEGDAGLVVASSDTQAANLDYKKLYRDAAPGVVLIHGTDKQGGSQGTGSIIDSSKPSINKVTVVGLHITLGGGRDTSQISPETLGNHENP
mgnify:CR=1 FL=1